GVAATHARDRPLIAQDRVHPPRVRRAHHELISLRAQRLGSELRERTVVAGGEDPPARLPLGPELLHQQGGAFFEPKPDDAPARLRALRRRLDIDATSL